MIGSLFFSLDQILWQPNRFCVNCFAVTKTSKSPAIDELGRKFGTNIPIYMPYESLLEGEYFIFCVKTDINVKYHCSRNEYKIGKLYEMEIDENTYNNLYQVNPTYSDKVMFELKKINFEDKLDKV